jgi:hypothetical protein
MPPVPLAIAARVAKMLERLRRTEQGERRGAVTGMLEVVPYRSGASIHDEGRIRPSLIHDGGDRYFLGIVARGGAYRGVLGDLMKKTTSPSS